MDEWKTCIWTIAVPGEEQSMDQDAVNVSEKYLCGKTAHILLCLHFYYVLTTLLLM